MDQLRPLSEAECYERLYGARVPTVTILGSEPRLAPWEPIVSAEDLRRAFEERLDARTGAAEEAA